MENTPALLLLLAALAVWDVLSTLYVLSRGGRESNPLLLKLFRAFPGHETEVLLGTKLVAACAIGYAAWKGELPDWALAGVVVLYAVVAVNNTKVVLRTRK